MVFKSGKSSFTTTIRGGGKCLSYAEKGGRGHNKLYGSFTVGASVLGMLTGGTQTFRTFQ